MVSPLHRNGFTRLVERERFSGRRLEVLYFFLAVFFGQRYHWRRKKEKQWFGCLSGYNVYEFGLLSDYKSVVFLSWDIVYL